MIIPKTVEEVDKEVDHQRDGQVSHYDEYDLPNIVPIGFAWLAEVADG